MGLMSRIFLFGLSRVLTHGANKYASHNWRKGIEYSRLFDALQRHLWAWWDGEETDPDFGESHLDHAACCLMFLRELSQTRKDLDDRYKATEKSPELTPGKTAPDGVPQGTPISPGQHVPGLQGMAEVPPVHQSLSEDVCPAESREHQLPW